MGWAGFGWLEDLEADILTSGWLHELGSSGTPLTLTLINVTVTVSFSCFSFSNFDLGCKTLRFGLNLDLPPLIAIGNGGRGGKGQRL
jgi:hypothetical protein